MKHKTLLISRTSIEHTILTHFPKKNSGKVTDNSRNRLRRNTFLKICKFPKKSEAVTGSLL